MLPINPLRAKLMELLLANVKKGLELSVRELREKQRKELEEHVNGFDINSYIEKAFTELALSPEAKEVFKDSMIQQIKFMLDINDQSVTDQVVKV